MYSQHQMNMLFSVVHIDTQHILLLINTLHLERIGQCYKYQQVCKLDLLDILASHHISHLDMCYHLHKIDCFDNVYHLGTAQRMCYHGKHSHLHTARC